jgi:hypothetical protein
MDPAMVGVLITRDSLIFSVMFTILNAIALITGELVNYKILQSWKIWHSQLLNRQRKNVANPLEAQIGMRQGAAK